MCTQLFTISSLHPATGSNWCSSTHPRFSNFQAAHLCSCCHAVMCALQVHGKLYKSLFDEDPRGVVASGFAIREGHWRWRSGTFNTWLPAGMQAAVMDEQEQVFVKVRKWRSPSLTSLIHPGKQVHVQYVMNV